MSAKKYLSLEEAAKQLGLRTDEVVRLRERGELRGFADRGTWKFKSDDVDECQRRRQPDSNPDVPLMGDDFADSALEMDVKSPPGPGSDSDVRLVSPSGPLTGSSIDLPVFKAGDSDSDVRLVGSQAALNKKGSDSDVKLIKPKDSDSDVKLSDSDSDVRLTGGPGSSTVLTDSDSDVRLLPARGSDSDVKLLDSSKSGMGRMHANPTDSSLIQGGDSALFDDDEGITLAGDSGISLAGDSGISLVMPDDSGIKLSDDSSALDFKIESSIKLAGQGKGKATPPPRPRQQPPKTMAEDDLDSTAPMLFRDDDDDAHRTDPEVPLFAATDDDDVDLMPKNFLAGGNETDAETSVIMFDDDDEVAPKKKKGGLSGKGLDTEESAFDLDATDDEELEVSDEILGEDDELEDLEVFETEDSDFDAGVSAADFAAVGAGGRMAVPVEHEWGWGTVTLASLSAVVLVLGAKTAADLLHTVSESGAPSTSGTILSLFGGFFK
jgi:excisionase family DNA binding protein